MLLRKATLETYYPEFRSESFSHGYVVTNVVGIWGILHLTPYGKPPDAIGVDEYRSASGLDLSPFRGTCVSDRIEV